MHTTPQKFGPPGLSSGFFSVSISHPDLDDDDHVKYAELACWVLRGKHRHCYPVSVGNVENRTQGIEMEIFRDSVMGMGTGLAASLIRIDLDKLGREADQLVFVLNQLGNFQNFDPNQTCLILSKDDVEFARFSLDLSTIGREGSLVLAVFDRDKATFGFPGIAVHDIDLVMHDLGDEGLPTLLTLALNSDFPSALGLQGPDTLDDDELFHLLKWGPEGFLRQVKTHHLARMSFEQGVEILAHYREALSNEDIIPVRIKLMKALMKMGVDWAASISEEAERMEHLADKIDELILVAHWKKSWARVISKTLSNENLIAYASSSKMKADYLYILEPRRCLLELVSDSLKAQVLEQDLGL